MKTSLKGLDTWQVAFERLAESEHFPELTARLRMAADVDGQARTTLAVMERAFAEGWVEPRPPSARTGRTVAVVGGGMVGLAASAALNQAGHYVRVYESSRHIGGLLCVGQGHVRVEQWVVDRRVRLLEAEGVEFVTSSHVGESIRFDELRAVSDALLLSIGHRRPRSLIVPGFEHPGVAMVDQLLRPRPKGGEPRGRRVLILGDGAGAERAQDYLQAEGARAIDVMPLLGGTVQTGLDRQQEGAWPLIHSSESGDSDLVAVVAIEGDGETIESVRFVRVDVATDPSGHPVIVPRPGSAYSVPADMVVVASGYVGPNTQLIESQLGVELDVRGNIAADRRFGTSVPGVFYAGDANPAASSLLWDLSQGLEVAAVIDARLGGQNSTPPVDADPVPPPTGAS